jgi:hypothetical protein
MKSCPAQNKKICTGDSDWGSDLEDFYEVLDPTHVQIYIALELGTSARRMMPSRALGKPDQI